MPRVVKKFEGLHQVGNKASALLAAEVMLSSARLD